MKTCRICQEYKPLSEFGRSTLYATTGERDGLNIYCRACNRERVAAKRDANRATRISPVIARRIARECTHSERVILAIRRGNRTREKIRSSAQLTWDDTMDAIAQLSLVQSVIYSKRIDGDVHFFERAA